MGWNHHLVDVPDWFDQNPIPCLAKELILRGLEDAHAMKRTVWDMKRRQSGLGGYASAGMAKATCQVVVFFFPF